MRVCVILKARLGVPMNIGYSEFFKVLYKQIILTTVTKSVQLPTSFNIE